MDGEFWTEGEGTLWDAYSELFNRIAQSMEANQENPQKLQLLIDMAIRLESSQR